MPFIERRGFNPAFRQHRRLQARSINRAHARLGYRVERRILLDHQRRCGNVDAYAGDAALEMLDARRIVDFRRR